MKQMVRLSLALLAFLATIGLAAQAEARPELRILEMSISPSTPTQGEPVRVRVRIANQGLKKAKSFRVVWFAGENNHMYNHVWHVDQLKPLHRTILEYTFPGYRRAYANVRTRAIVDDRNSGREIREGNNVKYRNIQVRASDSGLHPGAVFDSSSDSGLMGKPDLHITSLTLLPAALTKGEPIRVHVRIHNSGLKRAESFRVAWWPGENFQTPGCSWRVHGLSAGQSKTLTFTYRGFRSWYTRLITKAVADVGNEVNEVNEGNNVRRQTIRVLRADVYSGSGFNSSAGTGSNSAAVGKPDLQITGLTLVPAIPIKGEPVTVRVKVSNRGETDARSFKVRWWPGENYNRPGCTWSVDSLPAKTAMNLTYTYSGYPSWYSRLITTAQADIGNEVDEIAENNNGWRKRIQVRNP